MRDRVYVKFAEALSRQMAVKAAEIRRRDVHVKFAEALNAVSMQKRAAGKERILSALGSLYKRMSPEIKLRGKWDPRSLISSTRRTAKSVTNVRPFTNKELAEAAGRSGGAYAYGGSSPGQGPILTYGDLADKGGIVETTHLSPAKILAALGLTGGGAVVAKNRSSGSTAPIGGTSSIPKSLPSRLLSNKAILAALGGGTALAGGAGVYAVTKTKGDKAKTKEKGDNVK